MIENNKSACRISVSDFRHVSLVDTESTNLECFSYARAGDAGNLWVTAQQQSSGKGRRGRVWVSEAGNLYASLLLIDPAPIEKSSSLPLVAALAVYRAISNILPDCAEPIQIKWPNDLLIGLKKTSGILIEAQFLPDGRRAVVIGIGINISHKPNNTAYPVSMLNDYDTHLTTESVFNQLMRTMSETLNQWQASDNLPSIMHDWRKAAYGIGTMITVNLSNRSIQGLFIGIDDDGFLMLDEGDGVIRSITAGDVFFG